MYIEQGKNDLADPTLREYSRHVKANPDFSLDLFNLYTDYFRRLDIPDSVQDVEDVEICDIGTGINALTADRYVTGGDGEIRIHGLNGENTLISAHDGRIVFSGIISGDDFSVPTERGIYVIKAGSIATKAIVR